MRPYIRLGNIRIKLCAACGEAVQDDSEDFCDACLAGDDPEQSSALDGVSDLVTSYDDLVTCS